MEQNNIRYAIDKLVENYEGVLVTKSGSELDLTQISVVERLNIEYSQPGKSEIYLAFKIGNDWCKLSSKGEVEKISQITPDIETLRNQGNTIRELRSVSDLSALAGERIGLAIGLSTPDIVNARPKVKLGVSVRAGSQTLSYEELSPIMQLNNAVQIAKIESSPVVSGGGEVELTARAILENGEEVDKVELTSLMGEKVRELQIRARYQVREAGTGYAQVGRVQVTLANLASVTSGVSSGEIITQTLDWYMPIRQCRLTLKHAMLKQSELRAYCAMRVRPTVVRDEVLGVGTGERKTYSLKNKEGLKYDTIKLYIDGTPVYTDYDFNTQSGRVTCTVPEGGLLTCNYEYNWSGEEWEEMKLLKRDEIGEQEVSEYVYVSGSEKEYSVSAVKVELKTTSGQIKGEYLGVGAGVMQTYRLSRAVKDGKVTIYGGGKKLPDSQWRLREDTRYVSIAAGTGGRLTADYEWLSETPEVYELAAVFGE